MTYGTKEAVFRSAKLATDLFQKRQALGIFPRNEDFLRRRVKKQGLKAQNWIGLHGTGNCDTSNYTG
jgi:hypothetical protein